MPVIPMFTATLISAAALAFLPRHIGGRYPGMQSLVRWVSLGSLAAGCLLGALPLLSAAWGFMGMDTAMTLGGVLAVGTQLIAWLFLANWLPDARSNHVYDEQVLFRSLHALAAVIQ